MFKSSVIHKLSLLGLGFTVFSPNLALATQFQGVATFRDQNRNAAFQYSIQDGALHCGSIPVGFKIPDICQRTPISNPIKEIAFGDFGRAACALTANDEVECWSTRWEIKTPKVSNLKNPHQLIVSQYHACILDDDGLKCWSPDKAKPVATFPDFKDVASLNYAGYVIYGLKQGKIIAADAEAGQMIPSHMELWDNLTLTQLSVSDVSINNHDNQGSVFCGIESERVICKRDQTGDFAMGIRSDLSAPVTAIAAGPLISCAQTSRGIKCWRSESGTPEPEFDRPEIKNVRRIWALEMNSGVACVETNEFKIKCWRSLTHDMDTD